MTSQLPPPKGVQRDQDFVIRKNDGTVIANPGGLAVRVMKDGASGAASTNSASVYDTTAGACKITLTTTEMNADRIVLHCSSTDTDAIPTVIVLETAAQTFDDTDTVLDETLAAIGNISSGTAAINVVADSFTITTGTAEANDESDTYALDGTTHDLEDDAGTTDCYYEFDIGGNGVPVGVLWNGYVASQGDTFNVYAYDWAGAAWEQIGSIDGIALTTITPKEFTLATGHVGTGANIGKVRIRFYSTDGTKIVTDRILCSYAVVARSVGYADGAVWVDSAGVSGTETYVNGTADNPCPWADALVIAAALGLTKFHIANDNTVTLAAACDEKTLYGDHWYLAVGGQSINDSVFRGADVSGTGSAVDHVTFEDCQIGWATLPPGNYLRCGFDGSAGSFTGASDGVYVFVDCYSAYPGASFVFTGLGAATMILNRRWGGGSAYTLDSDCTLKHEVVAGGSIQLTTGGGDVEIRGIVRALTMFVSGSSTVRFIGTVGPVEIYGIGTAAVTLYGVASSVTDSSTGTTLTDNTILTPDMRDLPGAVDDNATILEFIEKHILNQLTPVDNGDGTKTYTLYDDDDTTPLKEWVFDIATGERSRAT